MSPKRLGVSIKSERDKKGWTQEELARKVPIHRVYLAQIESAVKVPSIATLEKIAKALKVDIAKLLK